MIRASVEQAVERRRGTRTERGYSNRWARAAQDWLRRFPFCAHCMLRGKVVGASQVDHVQPHKGDQGLFWNEGNWQSLCIRCHSRKTRAEQRGVKV